MKKIFMYGALLASFTYLATPGSSIAEANQALNLNELVQQAIDNSPALKAYHSQAEASVGELKQAGTYENPSISIEAENLAGSGPYKGYDSAETTYGISQKIIMPSKYSARVKSAEQGLKANQNTSNAARLDLIKNIKIAYANYIAAEQNLGVAGELKYLSEKVLVNITKRVNAAAEPLFQKSKAQVARSTAVMELQKAEREKQAAKNKLAVLLGSLNNNFEISQAEFNQVDDITITEDELLKAIDEAPEALNLQALEKQARFNLELEKANTIPDPTISLGVRDFRETKDQALVAGLSFPIPVFDQNHGNIIKAQSQVDQANFSSAAKLLELKSQALNSLHQMRLAEAQAKELKANIIPSAQSSFEQASDVYNRGKFSYLEVSDAQRTLFDAKFSLINALQEYHIQKAEIERFLLPTIQTLTEK